MNKPTTLLILFLITGLSVFAQVGINTDNSAPDPSAGLDVNFTNKGVLLPRLTLVQRNAITNPAEGLLIFNLTTGCIDYFLGGSWKSFCGVSEPSFQCGMKMTDTRDGRLYNTVKIGNQCWMAENLDAGLRIDSTVIAANNINIEKYCYHDDPANCAVYGGLYPWNEMMQYSTTPGVQGICPPGWHIPADNELTDLMTFLGGVSVAGDKLKEPGTAHWDAPNTSTNSSGFTARGAGWGDFFFDYSYWDLKSNTQYWSSTEYDQSAYLYYVGNDIGYGSVVHSYQWKDYRLSVRCLQ